MHDDARGRGRGPARRRSTASGPTGGRTRCGSSSVAVTVASDAVDDPPRRGVGRQRQVDDRNWPSSARTCGGRAGERDRVRAQVAHRLREASASAAADASPQRDGHGDVAVVVRRRGRERRLQHVGHVDVLGEALRHRARPGCTRACRRRAARGRSAGVVVVTPSPASAKLAVETDESSETSSRSVCTSVNSR